MTCDSLFCFALTTKIPIMFVAHSMGGLVVKKVRTFAFSVTESLLGYHTGQFAS